MNISFKAPNSDLWAPIEVNVDDSKESGDDVKANQAYLNNLLLSSLQMQHLVVLAGSGCSLSAGGPSMSNLWDLILSSGNVKENQAVFETIKYDISNKNIESLLSRIEEYLRIEDDGKVRDFFNQSKQVILNKCSSFSAGSPLYSHKTFISRLSRRRIRDQRLKIFTTNYDLCFESAAGDLGGVALDGFSFSSKRKYDPKFFTYDIVRRPRSGDDIGNYLEGVFLLYKLHGSVNWARSSDQSQIYEKAEVAPEEACLIYPARGKYQQSFTQPYLESIAQYLSVMRELNTCVVVVGFGFNDDHLSEPLVSAIQSNPNLRVIIVDPFAETKASTGNQYWDRLFEFSRQGEDVWFISANFDEFAKRIPDLKSLSPADNLMKAVQGAVRDL
jgi:hypothetical protein